MDIINLSKDLVPKIYQLEKTCYPNEFLTTQQINTYISDFAKNGLVIIDNQFTIGYGLVITDDNELEIRLGIHPQYRRLRHATRLLNKIKLKLNHSRTLLKCWVPETNLEGHLFLQSQGFICSKIETAHYERRHTSGYMFIYRLEWGFTENNGLYVPEEFNLEAI